MLFSLQPFRDRSQLPPLKLEGHIQRTHPQLSLTLTLSGNLETVEIPPPAATPRRKNQLWKTTCFEFFLGLIHSPSYWEFNLSPTGDWNVYHFASYRQGMQAENTFSTLPFTITAQSKKLTVNLETSLEPLIPIEQKLDIAIATVVSFKDKKISYWALNHCSSEADFHRRESFTIQL
jgi:hypothetical protein